MSGITWVVEQRPVQRTPSEAIAIAERIRSAALRAQEQAYELSAARNRLENNWKGRAFERFMGDFRDVQCFAKRPRTLEDNAETLRRHAGQIEELRVTMYEEVLVPVLVRPK